ncbi:hypothetical protein ACLGIH_32365 [Streptomyces sp. HMX87]|uniref:hypothetical protein n=1 Tax=Streptomyces sp. HMX87 TaxID=3390849 RepID=UPI003A890A66
MTVGKALTFVISAVVCAGALATGCAQQQPGGGSAPSPASGAPAPPAAPPAPSDRPLPGLGPVMRSRVPAGTGQVLVVEGTTINTAGAEAVLYEKDPVRGWHTVAGPWPAHNGLRGWTRDHRAGDLRTPIGVFGLRDAGGRLPDPGSGLPYDQDPEFAISGTGHLGESLEGSFDYVVAIDYNRVPGTTPLNKERPLGADRGGGVWIHVDHGGPTNACLSLRREHMRALLRALDPEKEPVVVMGPAAALRT